MIFFLNCLSMLLVLCTINVTVMCSHEIMKVTVHVYMKFDILNLCEYSAFIQYRHMCNWDILRHSDSLKLYGFFPLKKTYFTRKSTYNYKHVYYIDMTSCPIVGIEHDFSNMGTKHAFGISGSVFLFPVINILPAIGIVALHPLKDQGSL